MSHTPSASRFPRLFGRVLLPVLLLTGVAWLAAELPAQPPVKKRPPLVEEEEEKDGRPKKKRIAEEEAPPQKGKKGGPIPEERDNRPAKKKRIIVDDEQEEQGGRPKRKVIPVDDGPPAKKTRPPKPTPKPPVVEGPETDLALAAKQSRNRAVQELFRDLAFVHDVVYYRPKHVVETRTEFIEPQPQYFDPKGPPQFRGTFSAQALDQHGKRVGRPIGFVRDMVVRILSYEDFALERVNEFLKAPLERAADPTLHLTRQEMLAVAQRVLTFVLGEHASLRQRGLRGPEWDKVEEALKNRLFDLKVQQLSLVAEADDWDGAARLATQITDEYPDMTPADKVRVGKPLFELAQRALKRGVSSTELLEVQKRLQVLQDQFPNDPTGRELAQQRRQAAQRLFDEAQRLMEKDRTQAKQRLLHARVLDPGLPGLEDYYLRQEAEFPELFVGVRELPVHMAPGLARTESERAAVDLLFEGLVKASYDPAAGQRYEPALAEGRPRIASLGRQFQISRQAVWSRPDKPGSERPVTAADVRATIRLMKDPRWPGHAPAWAELFEDAQPGSDPQRVTVTLRQGCFDPLSLMAFKVLPPGLSPNAVEYQDFARKPYGSGPYLCKGKQAVGNRSGVVFEANPAYGARAGRRGLPHLRRVYFVVSDNPIADLQGGALDVVLPGAVDRLLEGRDTAKWQQLQAAGKVSVQRTRRIWFLAINHRAPAFQDANFRRALAHAIPREALLKEHFRLPGEDNVHRPLNGPYPPGSWANDDSLPPLDKPELADGLMKKARAAGWKHDRPVSLKYPVGDPRVEAAMRALAEKVGATLGITIEPEAVPPEKLREQVEKTHNYELAYYSYEYPTESYWLWPLLDPNSNYLNYRNDGDLESYFRTAMSRRDFSQVKQAAHAIHSHMQMTMPLVPLWQLDARVALGPKVRPVPFDSLAVFADIERWGKHTQ